MFIACTVLTWDPNSIIGPQFFLPSQEPRYRLGIGSCLVSFAILIASSVFLRYWLVWQNKKRATTREAVERQCSEADLAQYAFRNLTDKENPLFVYVY